MTRGDHPRNPQRPQHQLAVQRVGQGLGIVGAGEIAPRSSRSSASQKLSKTMLTSGAANSKKRIEQGRADQGSDPLPASLRIAFCRKRSPVSQPPCAHRRPTTQRSRLSRWGFPARAARALPQAQHRRGAGRGQSPSIQSPSCQKAWKAKREHHVMHEVAPPARRRTPDLPHVAACRDLGRVRAPRPCPPPS